MSKTTEKGGIRNDFERKEVVGVCHRDMRVSLIGSIIKINLETSLKRIGNVRRRNFQEIPVRD